MIDHPVQWIPSSTPNGCWAAAAAMMLGDRCAMVRSARLGASGGLVATRENVLAFATELRLRLLEATTLSAAGLQDLLRSGPVMFGGQMVKGEGHCVVIGGIDGEQVKVYDPKPIAGGGKWVSYPALMSLFPLASRFILYR